MSGGCVFVFVNVSTLKKVRAKFDIVYCSLCWIGWTNFSGNDKRKFQIFGRKRMKEDQFKAISFSLGFPKKPMLTENYAKIEAYRQPSPQLQKQ